MRLLALSAAVLVIGACAARPPADRPEPEFVHYEYAFDGHVGSQAVNGNVRFQRYDAYRIAYTLSSQHGHCIGEISRMNMSRVSLRCDDLAFEFVRSGRVRDQAPATLVLTELVPRRECASWTVTQSGQRVCAAWHTVLVERRVTQNGTLQIKRIDPTGWTG
jgi:hypothetical protein